MLIPAQHNRTVYLGIVTGSTGGPARETLKYTVECQRDQTRPLLVGVTPERCALPAGIEIERAPNGSPAIIVEAGGKINVYLMLEGFKYRDACA
jgi:hypothetical protein